MSEIINKLWLRFRGPGLNDSGRQPDTGAETLPRAQQHRRYLNREVSDLQFIQRVVEEASNMRHPFFERLRFLAISVSVLDQFYTVRVARLQRMIGGGSYQLSPDGLTPAEELRVISQRADALVNLQQAIWHGHKQELQATGIAVLDVDDITEDEVSWLQQYFTSHVLPVITPFTLDEEHPFPFIASGGICVVYQLAENHILIPLPEKLPRFIRLPGKDRRFVLLEDVLLKSSQQLFAGEKLITGGTFQILRDNDLAKQARSADLRSIVESGLRSRHRANVVRLIVKDLSEESVRFISYHLNLLDDDAIEMLNLQGKRAMDQDFIIAALPGLSAVSQLIDGASFPQLLFDGFEARYPQRLLDVDNDCFAAITAGDLLVHWPYESFDVVVRFLDQAAADDDVISIKQTLYRTSDDSPIVRAMVEAASRGKTVTAVIELEARDNEQANVAMAKRLEDAGVHIIYGIIGLKIHSKLTVVTRREGDDTVIYSHFGTGNYHPGNARTYTDLSFFTRDQTLGADASRVFNYISSEYFVPSEAICMAPKQIRSGIYACIDNEISNARAGKPAAIWSKVNSLTDPELIDKLYEASGAGVKVELIVRRHCSLIPGVPGLSENIRVKSIVGRFLEHARIYCFANGTEMTEAGALVYLASADWMERNLDERVEVMVPMNDQTVRRQILEQIMRANLLDTRQSWYLYPDGEYQRADNTQQFCAQSYFMQTPSLSGLGSRRSQVEIGEPNFGADTAE